MFFVFLFYVLYLDSPAIGKNTLGFIQIIIDLLASKICRKSSIVRHGAFLLALVYT